MSPRAPELSEDDRTRIEALELAVDCYERERSPLKAIAACKRILLVDPDHAGTRDRIERLCGMLHDGRDFDVAKPVRLEPGRPLEDLVLGEVVDDAPPADLDDDLTAQPLVEIGIDWKLTAGEEARQVAAEALPRTPLFSSLDAESLRRLVDGARLVELAADHELFHQGDPGGVLYVVVEGAVVPIAEGEPRKKLAVLEEGDFFGEVSLVTARPRSATIEALVDSKLLAIDRALVADLVERQPAVLTVLLRYLRDRLIARLVRTSPFFTSLPAAERETVARRFKFLEAADGAMLVRQGQPSSGLYALLSGRVRVIHSDGVGDKQLAVLEAGDVFGEMSMLSGEPGVATCLCDGKCWVLALSRNDYRALADEEPAVREAVEALATARRLANETSLVNQPYLDGRLGLL
jgi:CRP-like cAMP-binding protein